MIVIQRGFFGMEYYIIFLIIFLIYKYLKYFYLRAPFLLPDQDRSAGLGTPSARSSASQSQRRSARPSTTPSAGPSTTGSVRLCTKIRKGFKLVLQSELRKNNSGSSRLGSRLSEFIILAFLALFL